MSFLKNHKDYFYVRITYDNKCTQVNDHYGHAKWWLVYEQMNNCEFTDGPLADHCDTIVIADLGPWPCV